MTDETKGFFERVKKWVRKNNTTIETVMGEVFNASENVYFGWKKGNKLPSASHLYKLAKYMNVSMEWLIAGDEADKDGVPPSDDERRLLENYRELDELDKGVVRQTADALSRRGSKRTA